MKKLIRSLALLVALLMLTSFALCSCDSLSGVIDDIRDILLNQDVEKEEDKDFEKNPEEDSEDEETPGTEETPDDEDTTPEETPEDGEEDEGEEPELNIITIAEAIEICAQYNGAPSTERYYIRGIIETVTNAAYGAMKIKDEDKKAAALLATGVRQCVECGCCSYVCPAHRPVLQTNDEARSFLKKYAAAQKEKVGGAK